MQVARTPRGTLALVTLPFLIAIGVVAASPVPQPYAVVVFVIVGVWFARRRADLLPSANQVAVLGTLVVLIFSTVRAWWLDCAVGLIVAVLLAIAFLALAWRANE